MKIISLAVFWATRSQKDIEDVILDAFKSLVDQMIARSEVRSWKESAGMRREKR